MENLFQAMREIIDSTQWEIGVFTSTHQPERAKLFCHRYTEILKDYGMSNIIASDPAIASFPGIYHVYIHDKLNDIMIAGGRLHLGLDNVPLPIEKAISDLVPNFKEHIRSLKSNMRVAELSGFCVDRKYLRSHLTHTNLVHIISCLLIGLAMQCGSKKIICLSSRWIYKYASFTGLKIIREWGDNGKIPYPPNSHCYYMECDLDYLVLPRNDMQELAEWSKINLKEKLL